MSFGNLRPEFERLRLMEHVPSHVRLPLVEILEEISELRSVPRDGVWLRENEPSENKGYVLLKGSVVVRKAGAPDTVVQAPELLGEAMQFNPKHLRTATVVANEDIVVARFLWDEFWSAVEQRCSEPERQAIREAVETVAWDHLAG